MTTLTDDQQRALDWQARQRQIAAARAAAEARLAGDPGEAKRLRDAWAPVILARREDRNAGYDDPDCEDVA